MVRELRSRSSQKPPLYQLSSDSEGDHYNPRDDPDYNRKRSRRQPMQEVGESSASGGRRRPGRPRTTTNTPTPRTRFQVASTSDAPDSSQYHTMTVLNWMISKGVIAENQKVLYMHNEMGVLQEGRIRRNGILCQCCHAVLKVSDFETHVGQAGQVGQPYKNILVVPTGPVPMKSLMECQQQAWLQEVGANYIGFNQIQHDGADGHDDACLICADGGTLLCCGGCPSTSHAACMDFQRNPEGEWRCPYCVCKYCGRFYYQYEVIEEGEEKITRNPMDLLKCDQCNKKFNWVYFDEDRDPIDLNRDPTPPSYCGGSCKEVHKRILELVGVRQEMDEEGYSWTLLRRVDASSVTDEYRRTLSLSKLAVARQLMNECFLPLEDRHTRINFIDNVVFNAGSNYPRINFSNFFTLILEKNGEMVAAACARIHGPMLAEMPYMATREKFRRQGMSRRLLGALTELLQSLEVRNLVIPASGARAFRHWMHCGFENIDESTRRLLMNFNTLMFPGTNRLQLRLPEQPTASLMFPGTNRTQLRLPERPTASPEPRRPAAHQ